MGRFSTLDYSTAERVPVPNGTSSESSRRDVSSADLFGTDNGPTVWSVEISTMENWPRGVVMYTIVHGIINTSKK